MIRVLIVDDSPVAREFLAHILTADPSITVAGFAENGAEALAAVRRFRPDVVTMDIHMPGLDGYRATLEIMANAPVPIIIVSASEGAKESASMFLALDAGALAVVLRPPGIGHPDHPAAARELVQMIKLMSEIKVVKRLSRVTKTLSPSPLARPTSAAGGAVQLVAIGASIGGPPVLKTILSLLTPNFPVPVVIVQHISPGFVEGFMDWLSASANFPLHLAVHGQRAEAGHGYIAPDSYHLGLTSGLRLVLSPQPPENGSRPSVDYLFRSVAESLGPLAVGVLLTGMGRDGADGLKLLRDTGAATLVQDEASSVVHGMPGEAIKLGAAAFVLRPERIAATLLALTRKSKGLTA
ncbi:MAG: chemotaxis-specific protein-glutamate methyltransferase CheB [Anaerolineales bacterium]